MTLSDMFPVDRRTRPDIAYTDLYRERDDEDEEYEEEMEDEDESIQRI